MAKFRAYAANKAHGSLEPFDFDPGPLGEDQVEIAVEYCGLCHSDLAMLDNEWGMSSYPFVPGHEVVGKIAAVGHHVKHLKVGQSVGLGWYSGSCMTCPQCMAGDHNLCPQAEATIVGRHGGFADRVRCHAAWAIPLGDEVDHAKAGPLFCGGVTVFNPIVQLGIKPTDRVGVIGIGGLGHMALQFLRKWGCEVVAFSSSDNKKDEAMSLGAHRVVNSRDDAQIAAIKGSLNYIISTVNVAMNWPLYFDCLAPRGKLHTVGAIAEPVSFPVFPLILGQKGFTASPLGSPQTTATMIDFCGRHKIEPVTELFPASKINDAFDRLRSGKARYRVVVQNDMK